MKDGTDYGSHTDSQWRLGTETTARGACLNAGDSGRMRHGNRKRWEMPVTHSHPWQCALAMVTLLPLTAISCSYRVEAPAKAKVGFPRDYRPGAVETRFQTGLSLWVVHDGRRI